MEKPALSDPSIRPTDELIYSIIGKNKTLWTALFEHLRTEHPDIQTEWRYYNDGKSWLLKAVRKSKTVFWLSVVPKTFRVTFYVGAKYAALVRESGISPALKRQYEEKRKTHKTPGITVVAGKKSDTGNLEKLIALKIKAS